MKALFALALLSVALLAGCSDDSKTDDPTATEFVPGAMPKVDAAAVLSDLKDFSATYGERAQNLPGHEGARQWIAKTFEDAGLDVWRYDFNDGIDQADIVGIKWGEVKDQWVVVGGHYDTVTLDCLDADSLPCPLRQLSTGTYDDGSGTMLTVKMAQAFANVPTYYTMAFVAFDGEERGLQGSRAFVQAQQDGKIPYGDVSFHAMLDLDMFGLNCPSVDTPIYFDSNSEELKAFVADFATANDLCEDTIIYHGISLGQSDYGSFFDVDVPTGFFISDFEQYQLPADLPVTYPDNLPINSPIGYGSAYLFWHFFDTYDTMALMAGSESDLEASFQVAADLATGVAYHMAASPDTVLTATPAE